jgi:hypothetical protein
MAEDERELILKLYKGKNGLRKNAGILGIDSCWGNGKWEEVFLFSL